MILNKDSFEELDLESLKNAIFVYPTDSIYGIGCDARNESLISKLRLIKNRNEKPFSIIAPSISWVRKNFILNEAELSFVNQFSSLIEVDSKKRPFTLLLKPKEKNLFPKNLTFGLEKIGVRIPNHWVSEFVNKLSYPIITTSVNETGIAHMTSIKDIDKEIELKVDYIVDEGELLNNPSVIVFVKDGELVYLNR